MVRGSHLAVYTTHHLNCSGKTTLLLTIALSCAARGLDVTMLCRRSKMDMQTPRLPPHVPADSPALQRVAIKYGTSLVLRYSALHPLARYINSLDDLCKWCACVHLHPPPLPSVLIVDDLHMLVNQYVWLMHCTVRIGILVPPLPRRDQRRSDRDAVVAHALAMLVDAVSFISYDRATQRWCPVITNTYTEAMGMHAAWW